MDPARARDRASEPPTNGSPFFIVEGTPSHLHGKHTIFVVGKIARVKRGGDDKQESTVRW
jgi:hypothetical protein